MQSIEKGVTYRLFAGFWVNSEMRVHLQKSAKWKESQILRIPEEEALQIVPFEEKEYIGRYLPLPFLSINEIPKLEEALEKAVHDFCPGYLSKKQLLRFFAQPFIH
jgi:hypothetical protein